MAQRTLAENVAQVKADFKAVKDALNEKGYIEITDEPTKQYGAYAKQAINTAYNDGIDVGYWTGYADGLDSGWEDGFNDGYNDGIYIGEQSVISNSKYIEKSSSGKLIRLNDVSELAHKVKVYADVDTVVKVYGLNFIDYTKAQSRGSTGGTVTVNVENRSVTHTGTYYFVIPVNLIRGKTYTLNFEGGTTESRWRIAYSDGTLSSQVLIGSSITTMEDLDVKEIRISRHYDGIEGTMTISDIRLNLGTTSEHYEEYREPQTITARPLMQTEISSICPSMIFFADNDITVDYFGSYGIRETELRHWSRFTMGGTRINYTYGFAYTDFTGYEIPHGLCRPKRANSYMFYSYLGEELPKGIDFSLQTEESNTYYPTYYGFTYATKLKWIPDMNIKAVPVYHQTYRDCGKLKGIEIVRCNENTTFSNSFMNCGELEYIRFEGTIGQDINLQWSKKLTLESLISLIDHLKQYLDGDQADAYTKTITLSAESKALLREASEAEYGNEYYWEDQIFNNGWNMA